jgi:hypothetical protein
LYIWQGDVAQIPGFAFFDHDDGRPFVFFNKVIDNAGAILYWTLTGCINQWLAPPQILPARVAEYDHFPFGQPGEYCVHIPPMSLSNLTPFWPFAGDRMQYVTTAVMANIQSFPEEVFTARNKPQSVCGLR